MFRMGGSTGTGITSGLDTPRQGYKEPGVVDKNDIIRQDAQRIFDVGVDLRKANQIPTNKMLSGSLPGFLTSFGLNLASKPPTGNIFSTAAGAAREPFGRFMDSAQRSQQTKAALALEALDDKDLDKIEELIPYYMDVYNIDEDAAKKKILEDKRFSKSGKLDPKVAQGQKIEKRASVLLDDKNFGLGYDGAIQISTAIQNVIDGRNKEVSKDDIDLTQIYIDPDALGAEDPDSGIIKITQEKGIYTPGDYQEGLKYYHPIKGKFYTFQGETFIPVIPVEPAQ